MFEISIHYPYGRRIDEPSSDRVRFEFVLPKRPFLFWDTHEVGMRMNIPKGYGIAWFDFECNRYLYALMPFNILCAFGIWLWIGLRYRVARKLCRRKK